MRLKHRLILLIADGWGYAKPGKGNYISQANTPVFNRLIKNCPHTLNQAAGNAVGLPKGSQGNSEVGHLHIGAGRIAWQMYEKVNIAIRDRSFFRNKVLLKAMMHAKKNNSNLHLIGMCSDEGVHSHINHLIALLEMAKKIQLKDVFINFIADGRDVPEKSAKKYAITMEKAIKKHKVGKIISIAGRYYSMDRDNNWDRTKMAYKLLVEGVGFKEKDPIKALKHAYKRGEESKNEGRAGDTTDYYVRPIIIVNDDYHHFSEIKDNDSVIFWNFRSDRTRQLTAALTQKKFDKIHRGHRPKTFFVCMSEYDKNFKLPVAFPQQKVSNNLGEVIAKHNLKQLRIAETEKYAHVTFFLNSQIEKPNNGEDRLMVHSPKVPSYDLKPEMNAFGITEKLLPEIEKNKYGLIVVNFANGDLVGHSGNLKAGIKACEAVDNCVGKIVDSGLKKGYVSLITGDHGNVEIMFYPNGEVCPAHGTNPVPFFVISKDKKLQKTKLRKGNGLSDVAPTILDIMGIKKPKEMTGKSLIL